MALEVKSYWIYGDQIMVLETEIGQVPIESNLKQFLVVLSVSLGVATLPQIFSFFSANSLHITSSRCGVRSSLF